MARLRFIHDGDASGRLKPEEGFREGQVFLPISEAVLQLNASGLEYAHIRQFTCLWIDLEKHLVELFIERSYRTFNVALGVTSTCFQFLASRAAAQYHIAPR